MKVQNAILQVKREWRFYLCGTLAVVCAAVFALLLHARTLPPAEGWYTYYAACVHRGLLPYRDFEYLYPPFYVYFIAGFTRVFGYELILLRRLGVLIFSLIAWALYLLLTAAFGKQHAGASFFAVLAAVFYMQAEVVQIFYDYVRVMDLVNMLAVWRLVCAVRASSEGGAAKKALLRCGFWLGLLLQIKQNTGLVMLVFCLAAWVFLGVWQKRGTRRVLGEATVLLLPVAVLFVAVLAALACTGSLSPYFSMVWGRAADAKGGMAALLFGWLWHNAGALRQALPLALLLLLFLIIGHVWCARARQACTGLRLGVGAAAVGACAFFGALLLFCSSRDVAAALLPRHFFSVYAVFLTVMPLFAIFGCVGICDMVRGTRVLVRYVPCFLLSGAFTATAFACANSGGLADGQAYFGVAFLAMAVLGVMADLAACLPRGWRTCAGAALRALAAMCCLVLALQSAGKKMLYTYNWWGMQEATYWQSREESTLPLLRGIRVSSETAALYEGIVTAVRDNVGEGETIYCFAHIPIFYSLCERDDPGVFAKVQWFDVASDAAVLGDRAVLAARMPRAVLVYHTAPHAYEAHEASFRGGEASGMRLMRDFLLTFVQEHGYMHYGDFEAHGNRLSLYILP